MKIKFKRKISSMAGIALISLLFPFALIGQTDIKKDKNMDTMLCRGSYWTEAQGKAFQSIKPN